MLNIPGLAPGSQLFGDGRRGVEASAGPQNRLLADQAVENDRHEQGKEDIHGPESELELNPCGGGGVASKGDVTGGILTHFRGLLMFSSLHEYILL